MDHFKTSTCLMRMKVNSINVDQPFWGFFQIFLDRMMATKWPSESFTILSTVQTGCPSGFYEGGLKQHHKDTAMSHTSSTFSADIISEPTSTTYKFCTKKETDESTTSTIWPTGKYCVYRQGGKCPEGTRVFYF